MSDFDKESLLNLEKLCRIKLTNDEEKAFAEQLKKIIDYIEQLSEINTQDVEVCDYIQKDMHENVLREDEIQTTLSTKEFLSNAPDQIGQMIKVPPILKSQ